MALGFDMTAEGIESLLDEIELLPKDILGIISDALVDLGREFELDYVDRRLTTPGGGGGGRDISSGFTDRVQRRSGTLAGSFGSFVQGRKSATSLSALKLRIGFGVIPGIAAPIYTEVHEFGKTITPKKGQFLAIPAPDNMTQAGLPRKQSPRDLTDAAFVPIFGSGGASMLVFENDKLMFVLMRSVRIPPRLNFFRDVARFLSSRTFPVLDEYLQVGLGAT